MDAALRTGWLEDLDAVHEPTIALIRCSSRHSTSPGGVWYGGLLGAVLVSYWLMRRYQLPVVENC